MKNISKLFLFSLIALSLFTSGYAFSSGKELANGVECRFSSDCDSNYCVSGKCEAKSGSKALGNGVECRFSSDCASNYCVSRKCEAKSGSKALGNGVACRLARGGVAAEQFFVVRGKGQKKAPGKGAREVEDGCFWGGGSDGFRGDHFAVFVIESSLPKRNHRRKKYFFIS